MISLSSTLLIHSLVVTVIQTSTQKMEVVVAAKPIVKVVALCGSLRRASFNRGLLRSAIKLSQECIHGMEIEYIDIEPLPMLNPDLVVDGNFPPLVEAFRRKILESDSVLFASPEYNYSVTAPLKNAIDWASVTPNVWADKTAAVLSAGYDLGGGRAQYHLRQIGVCLDLHFINKPEFFLNAYEPPAKFDSDGNLIDEDSKERIKELLLALQAFTFRLKASVVDPTIAVFASELMAAVREAEERRSNQTPVKKIRRYIARDRANQSKVVRLLQFVAEVVRRGHCFGHLGMDRRREGKPQPTHGFYP